MSEQRSGSDTNDFPVLHALETMRGTLWGRLQPGFEEIAQVALAPTTRRLQLGDIGCVTEWSYPELPSRFPRLPLWCEGVTPLIPYHNTENNAGADLLEEAVFCALYSNTTPVGVLLTEGPDWGTAMSVRFISLPFPTMPLGAPARVMVDLEEAGRGDDLDAVFPRADFHRARLGLPLAAEATPAELLAAESRVVLADGQMWLRSRVGDALPRCFLGESLPSTRVAGLRNLRSVHARTFVEHVPHALGKEAIEYKADGVDLAALAAKRLDWIVTAGPYYATTVLAAAEKELQS